MGNKTIDFLRRRSSGIEQRSNATHKLRALGVPADLADFLPLEESDAIRQKIEEAFVDRRNPGSGVVEKQFYLADLGKLSSEIVPVLSEDIYVVPFNADIIGVLKWPVNTLNRFWKDLVEMWGDGVILVDSRLHFQMVVQVINDFGEDVMDFGVWGEEWGRKVLHLANSAVSDK